MLHNLLRDRYDALGSSYLLGGAVMAQKWEIVDGPEFWQLVLALTEGKRVQFTLKPPDQRGNWVCEAQIFSWGVIGAHREHEMTLFGRVTAIKEPKHV